MENNNENIDKKPVVNGSSGTGALGSIIFLIIVIIFMVILAHFKGN
ncbi:hypothetical protein IJ541_04160 [bacterium]|nr:hypothetical protein [bacterium]